VDVFPNTPDRKIDLFPAGLESSAPSGLYADQADPATDRFPLALISPASDRTISSTLGELPRPDAKLLMHPTDADARGLADKDLVRVFNELGEVQCEIGVTSSFTATALVPDTLTDLGGGACFNDARVQVESLATA
jgi:anaerobic selenocysteine-containing dehydrogenase